MTREDTITSVHATYWHAESKALASSLYCAVVVLARQQKPKFRCSALLQGGCVRKGLLSSALCKMSCQTQHPSSAELIRSFTISAYISEKPHSLGASLTSVAGRLSDFLRRFFPECTAPWLEHGARCKSHSHKINSRINLQDN